VAALTLFGIFGGYFPWFEAVLEWGATNLSTSHLGARFGFALLIAVALIAVAAIRLQGQVDDYESEARPNIVFVESDVTPTPMPTERKHFVGWAEFANRPKHLDSKATAENIRGDLAVFRENGTLVIDNLYGYWGDPASFHDGDYPFANPRGSATADLDVNGHALILQLVHKQSDSRECFVWKPRAQHDRVPLPYDWTSSSHFPLHVLRVRLHGLRLRPTECEWWFEVVTQGTGCDLRLRPLASRPWPAVKLTPHWWRFFWWGRTTGARP
jgi:hypothetical protein